MIRRRSFTFLVIVVIGLVSFPFLPTRHAHANTKPSNQNHQYAVYVVKAGDTLLAIALESGISMAAIQRANDLDDPRLLQAGQTLRIPSEKVQPDENAFWILHVVQAGETLSAIATQYDVTLNDLTRVNQIADASAISIGQKVVVPVSGRVAQAAPAQSQAAQQEAAPPTPTPELIPLIPLVPLVPETQQAVQQPTPIPLPIEPIQVAVDVNIEATRARLLELYNQVRIASGLQPLAYSFVLQAAAQGHADDCAARGSGSHFGSDGSKSSQRMARAGFAGRITGENWAWARTADKAFDMWYTQEIPNGPHLLNIMSPRYTEVGFGIAASKGGYYMIANFGG